MLIMMMNLSLLSTWGAPVETSTNINAPIYNLLQNWADMQVQSSCDIIVVLD